MPPKKQYPHSCPICSRTYSTRSSFSNHRRLGVCRPITAIGSDIMPIKDWENPDLPETILQDAIDVINNNIDEAFPELFALIYFNDEVPQNKVIKFRNPEVIFGNVKAIQDGIWTINCAADFYETLDKVLHLAIEKIKMMALDKKIDVSNICDRVETHNQRRPSKKQREYAKVIHKKKYHHPPPPTTTLVNNIEIRLISDWDDLVENNWKIIESLTEILEPDFKKMTSMLDGDTTKGRILDFKTKELYPKVVRLLFFDPKTPEHRVIKLRNIAVENGALLVMVNGKWQEKNQKEFLPKLYALVKQVLCQVYNTFIPAGSNKMEGIYSMDNYLLADEHLKEYKTSHRELKEAVQNVIMAGEYHPPRYTPAKKVPPPPMRLTNAAGPPSSIAEYRKEISALPKDGQAMAKLKANSN